MASNPITGLTEEQCLALERAAETRSEFVDGEMFAMFGGTKRHADLQVKLVGELYALLRGSRCRAYTSDFRVRTASGIYTYPDVSIVCGEAILADRYADTLLNPVALFEVLSASSEGYDRGLKFQHYRTIESLQDYVLVNQTKMRVEQFTRRADGTWTMRDLSNGADELQLGPAGIRISLQQIYAGVTFA